MKREWGVRLKRRGTIVHFSSRRRPPRRIARKTSRKRFGPIGAMMLIIVVALLGIGALAWNEGGLGGILPDLAGSSAERSAPRTVSVTWVDGDSGTIDGREFRLHGVDAPEGSPTRAQCKEERALAPHSRAAAQALTRGAVVSVTRSHGFDRYGRELVDLEANGRSVANALLASGSVKAWNYEGGQSKPNWCR
jgi:hypothetical protein